MAPADRMLPAHTVAKRLHISTWTLGQWRKKGEGPPWVRIGSRTIRYPESGLRDYLAGNVGK